jgi:hypothetical protein
MTTWTDDHGIVHYADRMLTSCCAIVHSDIGPCLFDDTDKVITCLPCSIGGGQMRGLLDQLDKLTKLNDLLKVYQHLEETRWFVTTSSFEAAPTV